MNDLSLYGVVTHGTSVREPGDRVQLYDPVRKSWIGPAVTDNNGSYAFYQLPPGSYVLVLYGKPAGGELKRVFTANVTLDGRNAVRADVRDCQTISC